MEIIHILVDIFLHLDKHLDTIIQQIGVTSYLLLFFIIFMETGAVFAPFLPGDSLIFVAGALAAHGSLQIIPLYIIFLLAAILGDTANYWAGHIIGPKVFANKNSKILKQEYLDKTNHYFQKYGGKTIILGRFMPIVRTFAPFVAGIGQMKYSTFLSYNIIGGIAWVSLFTFTGYFFGNLPWVKTNFHYAVILIIVLSLMPGVYEYLKYRSEKKKGLHYDKASMESISTTFKKQHMNE